MFEFLSYLSEIGGFLGLLVGASFLTVCEFLDYIFLVVCKKIKTKNTETEVPQEQLLQRRKHRSVGSPQPNPGQAVPGPHRRRQLYRHLCGRHQAMDRRVGQHGEVLGLERGEAAAAA